MHTSSKGFILRIEVKGPTLLVYPFTQKSTALDMPQKNIVSSLLEYLSQAESTIAEELNLVMFLQQSTPNLISPQPHTESVEMDIEKDWDSCVLSYNMWTKTEVPNRYQKRILFLRDSSPSLFHSSAPARRSFFIEVPLTGTACAHGPPAPAQPAPGPPEEPSGPPARRLNRF